MLKRIALAGKPLAGKTTLANLLVEKYGYRRASMSAFIVSEYVGNIFAGTVAASEIYDHKEEYRQVLQAYGDQLGFQDPSRIIGIIQKALRLSGEWYHPSSPVVLDAIRGELQASAARALGFVVVDVWVDEETQRRNANSEEDYQKVKESMLARPDIESGVSSASVRLTPELSLDNQAHLLHLLPEKEVSRGPADQPFTPGSFANWGRY